MFIVWLVIIYRERDKEDREYNKRLKKDEEKRVLEENKEREDARSRVSKLDNIDNPKEIIKWVIKRVDRENKELLIAWIIWVWIMIMSLMLVLIFK